MPSIVVLTLTGGAAVPGEVVLPEAVEAVSTVPMDLFMNVYGWDRAAGYR